MQTPTILIVPGDRAPVVSCSTQLLSLQMTLSLFFLFFPSEIIVCGVSHHMSEMASSQRSISNITQKCKTLVPNSFQMF